MLTGGMQMDVWRRVVVRMAAARFQTDEVELAVMNATLGCQLIGKAPHIRSRTLEDNGFDAMLVVQVAMHARHRQVVVVVLQAGQPLCQDALMVVVYI